MPEGEMDTPNGPLKPAVIEFTTVFVAVLIITTLLVPAFVTYAYVPEGEKDTPIG